MEYHCNDNWRGFLMIPIIVLKIQYQVIYNQSNLSFQTYFEEFIKIILQCGSVYYQSIIIHCVCNLFIYLHFNTVFCSLWTIANMKWGNWTTLFSILFKICRIYDDVGNDLLFTIQQLSIHKCLQDYKQPIS